MFSADSTSIRPVLKQAFLSWRTENPQPLMSVRVWLLVVSLTILKQMAWLQLACSTWCSYSFCLLLFWDESLYLSTSDSPWVAYVGRAELKILLPQPTKCYRINIYHYSWQCSPLREIKFHNSPYSTITLFYLAWCFTARWAYLNFTLKTPDTWFPEDPRASVSVHPW